MTNTCPICFDDFTKTKRIFIELSCNHIYCRKCLSSYIRNNISISYPIKCPHPNCETNLDLTGNLKSLIGKKWIQMAQRMGRYNGCPSMRCRGLLVNGECNTCHIRICRLCGEIEHSGECNSNIRSNYEYIIQSSKPCPTCHVMINKDGGCDHMFCKRCKTHFSWSKGSADPNYWNPDPNELQELNHRIILNRLRIMWDQYEYSIYGILFYYMGIIFLLIYFINYITTLLNILN